jgi:hypothetical protein
MMRKTVARRFSRYVVPDPMTGCWLWTGALTGQGYGSFRIAGKQIGAHRFALESVTGPLPPGACVDHLCRVRNCVNPGHLEAVSNRENVIRGVGLTAQNLRKTHCPRGHEFGGDNLRLRSDGRRVCRECIRTTARDYQRRRRAVQS